MANHCDAAALLLFASLLMAVVLSGADARPTVGPEKTAAALGGAVNTSLTVSHDDAHVQGLVDAAATADVQPECDDDDDDKHHEHHHDDDEQPSHPSPPGHEDSTADSPYPLPDLQGTGVDQELCTTCDEPKTPPPCDCEPEEDSGMTCNKVHAVRDGETCYSMAQCAELGQDDFLKFNPNICCDHLFVGQWVCLDAECSESD